MKVLTPENPVVLAAQLILLHEGADQTLVGIAHEEEPDHVPVTQGGVDLVVGPGTKVSVSVVGGVDGVHLMRSRIIVQ